MNLFKNLTLIYLIQPKNSISFGHHQAKSLFDNVVIKLGFLNLQIFAYPGVDFGFGIIKFYMEKLYTQIFD